MTCSCCWPGKQPLFAFSLTCGSLDKMATVLQKTFIFKCIFFNENVCILIKKIQKSLLLMVQLVSNGSGNGLESPCRKLIPASMLTRSLTWINWMFIPKIWFGFWKFWKIRHDIFKHICRAENEMTDMYSCFSSYCFTIIFIAQQAKHCRGQPSLKLNPKQYGTCTTLHPQSSRVNYVDSHLLWEMCHHTKRCTLK